ncbi:MAG: hypothetical protein KHY88_07035 [Erysipelotrichaceae bacterium]|nr:hypothetical protein [Erysipelotrichaceae bacterium]
MEDFFGLLNQIIPFVIIFIGIYFTLVIWSCVIGTIKQKRQDTSLESCMSKTGNMIYGIGAIIYLILWCISIYAFVSVLGKIELYQAMNAFNGLTLYTVIFAIFIQDYMHVGRKKLIMGNRLFEYRRMKKVTYGPKHKASFIYGQKQYTFSTRFIDVTKLKKYLAKVK